MTIHDVTEADEIEIGLCPCGKGYRGHLPFSIRWLRCQWAHAGQHQVERRCWVVLLTEAGTDHEIDHFVTLELAQAEIARRTAELRQERWERFGCANCGSRAHTLCNR